MAGSLHVEVFQHLFASVCEEMGAALMRSAFSVNVKERRDFSCALFDGRGRMVAQAAHLPIHLGATPLSVEEVLRAVPLERGDAVLLNDPWRGGTHLPDLTLVSPVFVGAERRPSFYCANRAHHADVGGAHPGSMGPAADVHGEGLRIPPVHLVRAGRPVRDVLELLLANMRVPHERHGDLLAQWSANRLGERRLQALSAEHGASALERRAAELLDWTERTARAELRRLGDGTVSFEDQLGGADGARLRVVLTVAGGRATCDFRECDDQRAEPVNTTRAVVVAAAAYALRALLDPGTPTNDGLMRPVRVLTRPGSVIDARYPACVAAGNVETSQRLVDCLLGALARMCPERIPAASAGTMSNLTLGGTVRGEAFAHYETIAGGAGGGPGGAGAHAVQTHMTNTRNTPVEAFEREVPVRVVRYTVARGTGGAGRRPGGDGVEKGLRFLAPCRVGFVADRHGEGPWGLAGGAPGRPGRVERGAAERGEREPLPPAFTASFDPGAELFIRTPGGGGHGAPGGSDGGEESAGSA